MHSKHKHRFSSKLVLIYKIKCMWTLHFLHYPNSSYNTQQNDSKRGYISDKHPFHKLIWCLWVYLTRAQKAHTTFNDKWRLLNDFIRSFLNFVTNSEMPFFKLRVLVDAFCKHASCKLSWKKPFAFSVYYFTFSLYNNVKFILENETEMIQKITWTSLKWKKNILFQLKYICKDIRY